MERPENPLSREDPTHLRTALPPLPPLTPTSPRGSLAPARLDSTSPEEPTASPHSPLLLIIFLLKKTLFPSVKAQLRSSAVQSAPCPPSYAVPTPGPAHLPQHTMHSVGVSLTPRLCSDSPTQPTMPDTGPGVQWQLREHLQVDAPDPGPWWRSGRALPGAS